MTKTIVSASLAVLCAGPLSAASLELNDIFGSFGAVAQSYSGNSESEGRVIIAGDATGNISVNDREIGANADGFDDLIITGDATNANITVGQSGNVTIGGDLSNTNLQLNGGVQTVTLGGTRSGGNFNQNEDILIQNATNTNIPEVDFSFLQSEAARLGGLGGLFSVDTNASGQLVFGGASVLDLDFSVLGSGTGVFDLSGIDTLIINVAGNGGNIGLNFVDYLGAGVLDAAQSVVWNFFEATGTINLNTALFGHVLAPSATVNVNSSNEGSVIASTLFSNNGELHPLAFDGTIPPAGGDDLTPVPLPAGGLLLLTAIAGFFGLRRRGTAPA